MYAIKYVSKSSPLFLGLGELAVADEMFLAEMEEWSQQLNEGGLSTLAESVAPQVSNNSVSLLDELNSIDQLAMA